MSPPRFHLKHLAILVACLAVSFGMVGVGATVVASALLVPVALAPPGRRLDAMSWLVAGFPLLLLLSLYTTWLSAWLALGHRPVPSMDDPKGIGAIAYPYIFTGVLLFFAPFALFAAVGLAIARVVRRGRGEEGRPHPAAGLAILVLVWVAGYGTLRWDPLGAWNWIMD